MTSPDAKRHRQQRLAAVEDANRASKELERLLSCKSRPWPGQVEALLERGACVELKRKSSSRSPMAAAIKHGHSDALRTLVQVAKEEGTLDEGVLLALAVERKSHYILRLLLSAGLSANAKQEDGRGILSEALLQESVECAEALLEAGASVRLSRVEASTHDAAGMLSLAFSARSVDLLLRFGARVQENVRADRSGSVLSDHVLLSTPWEEKAEIIRKLVGAGASFSLGKDGGTVADQLLACHISVRVQDREELVAGASTFSCDEYRTLGLLVDLGCPITIPPRSPEVACVAVAVASLSPARHGEEWVRQWVATSKTATIDFPKWSLEYLLDRGLPLNVLVDGETTLLAHLVASRASGFKKSEDLIELLIARGADLPPPDQMRRALGDAYYEILLGKSELWAAHEKSRLEVQTPIVRTPSSIRRV